MSQSLIVASCTHNTDIFNSLQFVYGIVCNAMNTEHLNVQRKLTILENVYQSYANKKPIMLTISIV